MKSKNKRVKKTVQFTKDTIEPITSDKCKCCSHRNIIPQIRIMDLCMECFNLTCEACLTNMSICLTCSRFVYGIVDDLKIIDLDLVDYPEFE
jgi:hypothetical protein